MDAKVPVSRPLDVLICAVLVLTEMQLADAPRDQGLRNSEASQCKEKSSGADLRPSAHGG